MLTFDGKVAIDHSALKPLKFSRLRRAINDLYYSLYSGKSIEIARRRRENFGIWSLYTMGNTLILPAAGAKILRFGARMQGEMHWFCAPQARKFWESII